MKFKVGDKVRILKEIYEEVYHQRFGSQIGKIAEIVKSDGTHYYIKGPHGGESFFSESDLELVESPENTRDYNVGTSDYSRHKIQPWDIWLEYDLNPWDADIIKRILRTKGGNSRKLDYEKVIHICKERIRQIEEKNEPQR